VIAYLDSPVYTAADYSFDQQEFGVLRDMLRSGMLTLLYTTETEKRVSAQLQEESKLAIARYNRLVRKEMGFLTSSVPSVREIPEAETAETVESQFRQFLALDGVEKIPLGTVDGERLIGNYYKGKAPFCEQGDLGFRDSLVVSAIRHYAGIDKQVCIVSDREPFRRAFEEDDRFVLFSKLDGMIRFFQQTEGELADTEKQLDEIIRAGRMNAGIKDHYSSVRVIRESDRYAECGQTEIEDLAVFLSYIEEIGGELYALIDADMYIRADVSYPAERAYQSVKRVRERHEVPKKVRIHCICAEKENGRGSLKGYKIVGDTDREILELTDQTLYSEETL